MFARSEERFEFPMTNLRAVRPAQDSDQIHAHAGRFHPFRDPGHGAFDHFRHVELMRLRHEIGTEPQLQVIDPFPLGVLDIFAGNAAAGFAIRKHSRRPKHFREERHQPRLRLRYLRMRPELLHRRPRQRDVMLPSQLQDRFQPHATVEMAVEINEGKSGIDV